MPPVDRDCASPPASTLPDRKRGKVYWRSLEDLADTPEFREWLYREFPAGASELLEADRRGFLKIMGASLALAGLSLGGCRRWPQEKIAPFAHRPPGRVPGATEAFATSMELAGAASGLVVTSYDGRPIKIDGNPDHPLNRGTSDALTQAAILELYDPDRSRSVMRAAGAGPDGRPQRARATWADFDQWAAQHFAGMAAARGQGFAVLSEATSSPSVQALRRRLAERLPRAAWYEYEAINNDSEVTAATAAFERYHRARCSFDRATIIVSLDADFLMTHPAAVRHTREFAAGRRADDAPRSMNRLYVFESTYSLTGANADHRIRVRSGDVAAVAGLLAKRFVPDLRPSSSTAQSRFSEITPALLGVDEAVFARLLEDLEQARGRSIVIAGPRQPV